MKYGWKYYLQPTPKNVSKWMLVVKGTLATVATTEFVSGNQKVAFYILLVAGFLSELSAFFGDEPEVKQDQQDQV